MGVIKYPKWQEEARQVCLKYGHVTAPRVRSAGSQSRGTRNGAGNRLQEAEERDAFWAWYKSEALRGTTRRGPKDVNRIIDFKLSVEMEKVLRELELV